MQEEINHYPARGSFWQLFDFSNKIFVQRSIWRVKADPAPDSLPNSDPGPLPLPNSDPESGFLNQVILISILTQVILIDDLADTCFTLLNAVSAHSYHSHHPCHLHHPDDHDHHDHHSDDHDHHPDDSDHPDHHDHHLDEDDRSQVTQLIRVGGAKCVYICVTHAVLSQMPQVL